MTGREDDEVMTAVSFAKPAGGHAYEKQKRKIGDYATAPPQFRLSRMAEPVPARRLQ